MTIQEMHTLFDLIIDKTGSPYFTSNEKDFYLQRAEVTYVNGFFNPVGDSKRNAEATSVDVELLEPIISETFVQSPSTGKLTFASINSSLTAGTQELMYVLGVSRNFNLNSCGDSDEVNYRKSRFVRHNDFSAHSNNAFKEGTEKYPFHRYLDSYLKLTPRKVSDNYITLVRYPLSVTLDDPNDTGNPGLNAVNSELPDKAHNEIVYLALQAAGISIREGDFYQLVTMKEKDNV